MSDEFPLEGRVRHVSFQLRKQIFHGVITDKMVALLGYPTKLG